MQKDVKQAILANLSSEALTDTLVITFLSCGRWSTHQKKDNELEKLQIDGFKFWHCNDDNVMMYIPPFLFCSACLEKVYKYGST